MLHHYLPSDAINNTWTIQGACVTARRIARFGIPSDAVCWRYLIESPEGGWSYSFRAVWRAGSYMQPTATYAVIENYYADDTDLVADQEAAVLAVNDWLQGVPV